MNDNNVEFCKCENVESVYPETDDFGHWLKCSKCGKVVEGSYECDDNYDDY